MCWNSHALMTLVACLGKTPLLLLLLLLLHALPPLLLLLLLLAPQSKLSGEWQSKYGEEALDGTTTTIKITQPYFLASGGVGGKGGEKWQGEGEIIYGNGKLSVYVLYCTVPSAVHYGPNFIYCREIMEATFLHLQFHSIVKRILLYRYSALYSVYGTSTIPPNVL